MTAKPVKWYSWDGTSIDRHIQEVSIQRHAFDAFQNVCCPAISNLKLTCNSNIAAIMPGPMGFYIFKYKLKGTQEEDSEEYKQVSQSICKVLSNETSRNSE